MKKPKYPRILMLDCESLPNVGTFWSVGRKINIGYENIQQERRLVCISVKWLGGGRIYSFHAKLPADEKDMLAKVWRFMEQSDAVVAHNGDRFDIPYIKTMGIVHGLPPLPPFKQIDTLKIAKRKFYFNSNRLDYLGHRLGVGKKIKTDYGLWLACLRGETKALRKMVAYNRQDVLLLERVFNKLRPHVPNIFNAILRATDKGAPACSSCSSGRIQYRGYYTGKTSIYKRFQCLSCGVWGREPKAHYTARTVGL